MHASPGSMDQRPRGAETCAPRDTTPSPAPRRRRRQPGGGDPLAAVHSQRGAPAVALDWPFLGRDGELRFLHGLITGRERSGVVVAGPMGVGKTRLAREALRRAERAGLATVRISATLAATTLPLGAFASLIAAGALPPTATRDRAWMLRHATETLAARAEGRRLVLLVDDAHLLDEASAALVHQVASTGIAFVLATVRTDEPASGLVVPLWKDGLADRVELGGLPDETIAGLLTAAVGGPVEPETVARLTTRSRGNVLFLRELVTGAVADGSLTGGDGLWRLQGPLTPSSRLIELVEARLGDLTVPERALLELVSVSALLCHAELAALAEPALAEILERRGFLSTSTSGRRLELRLAHPVYGDVVRARISAIRERAIARALAEAVEATGARRQEDGLRVASWRLTGGGGTPDVLLAGAIAARWHYDYPLAERLARAAVDAGAGFDAALLAAQVAGLQGETDRAERELAALAARTVDDRQRALVALARTDNSVTWTGADDAGILDEAEACITDPGWRDQLAARRLGLLLHSQGPRTTAAAAEPLLDRAEGEAFVYACITGAYSLSRLGRIDEALDVATRGCTVQLATPTTLAWYTWWHAVTRCHALLYAGRFEDAEALATEHYGKALDEGSTEAQAVFALLPGFAACERGRVRTAARLAREATALNQQLGRPTQVRIACIYAALSLALGGQVDEAEQTLAALDALHTPPAQQHEADLLRARAWTAAAAGRLPDAHRYLEQAAALAEEIGDLVCEATALTGLARLGRPADVRHSLAAVARRIGGDLAPARVAYVDALADHDAERLESMSGVFEEMGADLLAAEAAAEAAVVRRRSGERRAATADQRRAATLAERCEGAVTPALRGIEARALLTTAERETALLAATGLSSRRIADDQCLSVRTVENRLQRVYVKLGISRRSELPTALDTPAE